MHQQRNKQRRHGVAFNHPDQRFSLRHQVVLHVKGDISGKAHNRHRSQRFHRVYGLQNDSGDAGRFHRVVGAFTGDLFNHGDGILFLAVDLMGGAQFARRGEAAGMDIHCDNLRTAG